MARRAIVVAFDQVDSWDDYASPEYPYGKVRNSLQDVDTLAQPTTTDTDNASNKAPFRLVTWDEQGTKNAN